jgi:O-antigen/teichoic acid export membrane protein
MGDSAWPAQAIGVGGVLRNLGWLLAGKGVGAVLSLVYLAVAARTLGAAGFGQFALIVSTGQAVAAFVGFQTWQIMVRYGMPGLNDPAALNRLIAFGVALDGAAALVGCVLAVPCVLLLGAHLGWSSTISADAIGFCVVMLLSIRSTAVGILRLHDRFDYGAAADAATPITRFVGALAVVAVGPSVQGFLLAWATAEIITAASYWLLVRRVAAKAWRLPWPRHAWRPPAGSHSIWSFTWQTNLGMTLAAVGQQYAVVLVGVAIGPIAAGNYRLAYQLSQALIRVSEMAARAAFAEFARAQADHGATGLSQPTMRRLLVRLTQVALAAAAAACLALLAARPALALIAGPGHEGAVLLLQVLGVAGAIELASVGFEPILVAMGRAGQALALRLASTLCLLIGLVLLLPAYGAPGVALATLLASCCAALLFGLASRRALHQRKPA